MWWNWGLGEVRNDTNQEKMLAGLYNLNNVTFANCYFSSSLQEFDSQNILLTPCGAVHQELGLVERSQSRHNVLSAQSPACFCLHLSLLWQHSLFHPKLCDARDIPLTLHKLQPVKKNIFLANNQNNSVLKLSSLVTDRIHTSQFNVPDLPDRDSYAPIQTHWQPIREQMQSFIWIRCYRFCPTQTQTSTHSLNIVLLQVFLQCPTLAPISVWCQ